MSEFDDLISQFGSGNNQKSNTDYSDLIKKFGSGETSVEPQQKSNIPRPFTSDTKIEKGSVRRPGITEGIKALPGSYLSSLVETGKEGISTVGKGINQISTQQPASGIGNVGMGILQTLTAPYFAAGEQIKKGVTELTGSPEIGERAETISTLGLPLARTAKTVVKSLPSNQAFDRLISTIGDEKVLKEGLERLKSNENLSVVDVFPSVKQQAQKLVTMEGKHQTPMIEKINKRAAGARDRVESLYDEAMGAPIDVVKKIEELKKRAKDTGSTVINPVVESRGVVDVTSVVKTIDNAISSSGPVEKATLKALKEAKTPSLPLSDAQSALFNARQRIRGDWSDKDKMFLDMKGEQGLHEVQKNLRAEAQALLDSNDPLQRSLGKKLMDVRNSLVEAGGKEYKEALSKYADDMSVQEAFQSGQNVLRNRPTHIEDRPEFLKKWLKDAKPDEVEAMREGARVAIDNQIRSMRFAARKGSDIPEVEFTKEKLKLLFGKEEVEKLAKKLKDEKDIAQSTSDLLKNSQTAMRDKAGSVVALPERKSEGLTSVVAPMAELMTLQATGGSAVGLGAGAVLGGRALSSGIHHGKTKLAQKANEEYAKLLFSEGEQRAELIKMLEQRLQSRPTMIQNLNRLGSVIAP